MIDHTALAEFLHSIGWRSPCDAQWDNLREAIPQIRDIVAPDGVVCAKITVEGSKWRMDYLSLPEGSHKLYLRGIAFATPAQQDDSTKRDAELAQFFRRHIANHGNDGSTTKNLFVIRMHYVLEADTEEEAIDAAMQAGSNAGREQGMSTENKLPVLTDTQVWCCSNGCGKCHPVPDEFETLREEDLQGNLIRREVENIFVSHCCRKDLMLWDEATQDFIDDWKYEQGDRT